MKCTILLSTYNGEKYLREQLNSLLKQTGVDVNIFVRDDGSSDGTQLILKDYSDKGMIVWYTGPNLKPAMSFLNLLKNAPQSDYYALCDQDDIWLTDKLEVAIKKLRSSRSDLYYSSFSTVDKDGKTIQENVNYHSHGDTLGAALVDLSVTGCTMVFTHKLLETVNNCNPRIIMMHDSWIYKVALCMGYDVIFDETSHIHYRQHSNNVIGAHKGWKKKWKSRFNRWFINNGNRRYKEVCELYNCYQSVMPLESLSIIEPIIGYKEKSITKRFIIATNKAYRTGNWKTDLFFIMSVIANRY